jgi:hypothetical protein
MENVKILLKQKNKSNNLNINKFALENMVKNPHVAIVAKRGSGKSWLVADVLKKLCTEKTKISIISPTDKMAQFYEAYFAHADISYEFDSGKIEEILEEQKYNIHEKNGINQIVVLDDCLSSKGEWAKDHIVSELLFNARHYHITYILTMQFPLGIKPELRCNFDYVFLLADDNISNQKRMYEHYAGMFPNFESFRQIYVQLTEDYGSTVIVNRGFQKNFLEKIFYYKAENIFQNDNNESDTDTESVISDDSEQDYFQEQFGIYLANPDKIKYGVVNCNSGNPVAKNFEESFQHRINLNSAPKQNVVLLKEFSFKNAIKNPVYFVVGKNKRDRNITIKKVLDYYFSQGLSKDITHIKNDTEHEVIKKIIFQQDSEEKQNNHIVVFDDCVINFDSLSNKKKCALYELFLRRAELNLTIIIQTSDTCYSQLKEKSIPEFVNSAVNYTLMLPEKTKTNKMLLYNLFGGGFGIYQDFDDIFSQITNDKTAINCMVTEKGNSNFSYLTFSFGEKEEKDEKEDNKSNKSYESYENLVNF